MFLTETPLAPNPYIMTTEILAQVAVVGDLWSVCCAVFYGILAVLKLILLCIVALPSLIVLFVILGTISALLGTFR